MDELPPKTPMTPGVGPRFGLEEETSFAGNTAPTVVSSEGTSTVAERLWRAKVAKKLQKKAWNRYWKKDKFCEAAGVRDADCKRYLELSRRRRDELSYDEEDELARMLAQTPRDTNGMLRVLESLTGGDPAADLPLSALSTVCR